MNGTLQGLSVKLKESPEIQPPQLKGPQNKNLQANSSVVKIIYNKKKKSFTILDSFRYAEDVQKLISLILNIIINIFYVKKHK